MSLTGGNEFNCESTNSVVTYHFNTPLIKYQLNIKRKELVYPLPEKGHSKSN